MKTLIFIFFALIYSDSKEVYTTIQMMDQVMVLDIESLEINQSISTEFSQTINCDNLEQMDCSMASGCEWMMGMCMESSSATCDYSSEMDCSMASGCEWMMGMCMQSMGDNTINTPHFIVLDEVHGYWFVTTIASGFVAQYSLLDNSFIDAYFVGDAPALLAVDTINKKIYCSRMMPMNGMGNMMPEAQSNIIQGLNYSSMGLSESEDQEYIINSPAPHGLAINKDGTELYTASNTADWIYKINTITHEITGAAMDLGISNTPDQTTQRLKPIQCLSVGDRLFVSCSAGVWYNPSTGVQDIIQGKLQMWNSDTMELIDTIDLGDYTSPWHIINSPIDNIIYVVLGGDNLYDTEGVAAVEYSDFLELEWTSTLGNSNFNTLHGIDISSDGSTLYVSGRGDGHIHVFNAVNGEFLSSHSLGASSMLGGLAVEQKGLPQLGDLNNNNLFNVVDIIGLVQIVLNLMMIDPYPYYASDLNLDGESNVTDIVGLVDIVLNR